MYTAGSTNQINQCEQIAHQLIAQTQQASQMYQQLMQQEQQNALHLEEIAQRERQAAQTIQMALQGHQRVVQQLQQVIDLCKQMEQVSSNPNYSFNPQPQYQPSNPSNQFMGR